jgi:hypothetical protein
MLSGAGLSEIRAAALEEEAGLCYRYHTSSSTAHPL